MRNWIDLCESTQPVQQAIRIMLERYPELLRTIPIGKCALMSARFGEICRKLGIPHTYWEGWGFLGTVSANRDLHHWNEEFLDNWNHWVVEVEGRVIDFTAHQLDSALPVPCIYSISDFLAQWEHHDEQTPERHADFSRWETNIAREELTDL